MIWVHLHNEIIDDITVELTIKLESDRPWWLYWSLLIQTNDAPPIFGGKVLSFDILCLLCPPQSSFSGCNSWISVCGVEKYSISCCM